MTSVDFERLDQGSIVRGWQALTVLIQRERVTRMEASKGHLIAVMDHGERLLSFDLLPPHLRTSAQISDQDASALVRFATGEEAEAMVPKVLRFERSFKVSGLAWTSLTRHLTTSTSHQPPSPSAPQHHEPGDTLAGTPTPKGAEADEAENSNPAHMLPSHSSANPTASKFGEAQEDLAIVLRNGTLSLQHWDPGVLAWTEVAAGRLPLLSGNHQVIACCCCGTESEELYWIEAKGHHLFASDSENSEDSSEASEGEGDEGLGAEVEKVHLQFRRLPLATAAYTLNPQTHSKAPGSLHFSESSIHTFPEEIQTERSRDVSLYPDPKGCWIKLDSKLPSRRRLIFFPLDNDSSQAPKPVSPSSICCSCPGPPALCLFSSGELLQYQEEACPEGAFTSLCTISQELAYQASDMFHLGSLVAILTKDQTLVLVEPQTSTVLEEIPLPLLSEAERVWQRSSISQDEFTGWKIVPGEVSGHAVLWHEGHGIWDASGHPERLARAVREAVWRQTGNVALGVERSQTINAGDRDEVVDTHLLHSLMEAAEKRDMKAVGGMVESILQRLNEPALLLALLPAHVRPFVAKTHAKALCGLDHAESSGASRVPSNYNLPPLAEMSTQVDSRSRTKSLSIASGNQRGFEVARLMKTAPDELLMYMAERVGLILEEDGEVHFDSDRYLAMAKKWYRGSKPKGPKLSVLKPLEVMEVVCGVNYMEIESSTVDFHWTSKGYGTTLTGTNLSSAASPGLEDEGPLSAKQGGPSINGVDYNPPVFMVLCRLLFDKSPAHLLGLLSSVQTLAIKLIKRGLHKMHDQETQRKARRSRSAEEPPQQEELGPEDVFQDDKIWATLCFAAGQLLPCTGSQGRSYWAHGERRSELAMERARSLRAILEGQGKEFEAIKLIAEAGIFEDLLRVPEKDTGDDSWRMDALSSMIRGLDVWQQNDPNRTPDSTSTALLALARSADMLEAPT